LRAYQQEVGVRPCKKRRKLKPCTMTCMIERSVVIYILGIGRRPALQIRSFKARVRSRDLVIINPTSGHGDSTRLKVSLFLVRRVGVIDELTMVRKLKI